MLDELDWEAVQCRTERELGQPRQHDRESQGEIVGFLVGNGAHVARTGVREGAQVAVPCGVHRVSRNEAEVRRSLRRPHPLSPLRALLARVPLPGICRRALLGPPAATGPQEHRAAPGRKFSQRGRRRRRPVRAWSCISQR